MAKYLFEASYTADGVKGLVAKGGTSRRSAVQAAVKSVGGKMEAFYFAFGGHDAIVIADLPDNTAAAGLALNIAATGTVDIHTVVLLTADEVDAATKQDVKYRPPGK